MAKHYSFPSINQFRNAIRAVVDRAHWVGRDAETNEPIFNRQAPIPTLTYRATVKMHGTNAGIVYDLDAKTFSYQSRERVLDITSDNAGFCLAMKQHEETVLPELVNEIIGASNEEAPDKVVIYGEWCGGNIQKGVALSQLPKMFVIFGVRFIYDTDGQSQDLEEISKWIDLELVKEIEFPEQRIFNALRFGEVRVDINFNRPEEVQNLIVDYVSQVENECPVGKEFGVSGVGEGLVWVCITPGYSSSKYWFKAKGEKHSASKVKTLASVDVEAVKALNDFVDFAVTENRLIQGLQNLVREKQKEFSMENMGDFIRWVHHDIIKEETDTIVANQFEVKKLGGPIANRARAWFIAKLNEGYTVD